MNYPQADSKVVQNAHEFLKHHPMAVISTVDEHNKPWGAAIYCVADEDFNFFFVTRSKTQKFKNIDANPHVAVTFADPETQTTVQVGGKITRVPSKDIIDVVFKKLAAIKPKGDTNWLPPVIKVHQGDWMILHITPDYAQFADYKQQVNDVQDNHIRQLV